MKNIFTIVVLLALFIGLPVSSFSQSTHPEIQFKMQAKGSVAEVARITELSEITRSVVNHPEFEKRVRGAWTKYGKAFSYSDDNGNQVFQKMLEGAELGGPKDFIWQLSYIFQAQNRTCFGIGRFKKCSSWVLGWTNPSTKDVYMNSLPWPDRDSCGIVGTQVHEQLHKLGYGHPVNSTSSRPLSVPYAVGTIASEICNKYFIP